ncbi:MAG: hypothetical protein ACO1N9_09715 [Flavobacterium sp.]
MKNSILKSGVIATALLLSLASCKGKEAENTDAMSPDTDTVTIDTTTVSVEADTTAVNPDTIMGP